MQNEQCGLCWDLKFDNRGNKTHDLKNSHNFTPLDYCVKCRESKYDSYGIHTHPENINYFLEIPKKGKNHKFTSGINAKYQEQKRKKRNIFVYIGVVSGSVTVIFNIPNFFL